MNINVLEYFDNVYISDGVRIALSTHGLGYIQLIAFVRQVNGVTEALETSS